MRISTDPRVAAAQRARAAAPKPTMRKRAFYFLLGAALGAVIGYGLLTARPVPPPSLLDPLALKLMGGFALVVGFFAGLAADRFWRSNTKYGAWNPEDD